MLAVCLYDYGGADWNLRYLRLAGIALAAFGMANVMLAFASRALNTAEKCALVFVFIVCMLSGLWLFMMSGLVKN